VINRLIERFLYKKSTKDYSLINILIHATEEVPYYTNFKQGDLSCFPILTKDIIRNSFEELKSKNLDERKWWVNTSGGSTGEPVRFIQDNEYLLRGRYTTYQQKKNLGYSFGDNFIKLWGDEREILKYNQSFKS